MTPCKAFSFTTAAGGALVGAGRAAGAAIADSARNGSNDAIVGGFPQSIGATLRM